MQTRNKIFLEIVPRIKKWFVIVTTLVLMLILTMLYSVWIIIKVEQLYNLVDKLEKDLASVCAMLIFLYILVYDSYILILGDIINMSLTLLTVSNIIKHWYWYYTNLHRVIQFQVVSKILAKLLILFFSEWIFIYAT